MEQFWPLKLDNKNVITIIVRLTGTLKKKIFVNSSDFYIFFAKLVFGYKIFFRIHNLTYTAKILEIFRFNQLLESGFRPTSSVHQKSSDQKYIKSNTVKFCGLSPVQLPNNSGAGPGTGRGTAREISVG